MSCSPSSLTRLSVNSRSTPQSKQSATTVTFCSGGWSGLGCWTTVTVRILLWRQATSRSYARWRADFEMPLMAKSGSPQRRTLPGTGLRVELSLRRSKLGLRPPRCGRESVSSSTTSSPKWYVFRFTSDMFRSIPPSIRSSTPPEHRRGASPALSPNRECPRRIFGGISGRGGSYYRPPFLCTPLCRRQRVPDR